MMFQELTSVCPGCRGLVRMLIIANGLTRQGTCSHCGRSFQENLLPSFPALTRFSEEDMGPCEYGPSRCGHYASYWLTLQEGERYRVCLNHFNRAFSEAKRGVSIQWCPWL
ncbi:hypothetical protein [Reticulibacter mediterranei]|uniref:hypothetical protein n=1 Tax=Reticulibacter mediterranei TaxID=2778369 RepID=UPI001C68DE79|nr:hypothetical protein [Reticulibacter mediterranei]